MPAPLDLIIFDLGRVLVDFDFKRVVTDLGKFTHVPEKDIYTWFEKTPLWDTFERGLVSPEGFFKEMSKGLHLKGLSYDAFLPLWNHIFTEKADTLALVERLRGRYRLAILSNVNILHWDYVSNNHHFIRWFDHPIASYAIGYRKPDREIFQYVLDLTNVSPSRAMFIDDLESHVLMARQMGIRAHQFHDAAQLKQDISEVLDDAE